MAAVTIRSDFRVPKEEICHYFHLSPSICHEVMGLDAMILVFLTFSFKLAFSFSSFTLQRRQWQPTLVLLPGKSPGRRSLVGCSPRGHEELDTYWATSLSLFTFMHWRKKWQPTPVFLPEESHMCWNSTFGDQGNIIYNILKILLFKLAEHLKTEG